MYNQSQLRQVLAIWKRIAIDNFTEILEYKKIIKQYSKGISTIISELYKISKIKNKNLVKNKLTKLHTKLVKQFSSGE